MQLVINGQSISINDLVNVARHRHQVILSESVKKLLIKTRQSIDKAVDNQQIIYGVTTGFGAFKNTVINKDQTKELQKNLILSHSVGVGDYLPTEVVRGIMLLMVNSLSKGFSGIRLETITTLVKMLNKGVHPLIPEKGSVGSSGDLAPSAHLVLVLIGLGEAEYQGKKMNGKLAMKIAGIKPTVLDSKEGLALINNTWTMTTIGALLIHDSHRLIDTADTAAALSLQALQGTDKGYDSKIHRLKPHKGQLQTANHLRQLLKSSSFIDRRRIQEAYSFRCVPQVHGAVREALAYTKRVIITEINSITDNPLIFSKPNGQTYALSGGNFHGESVAIAMDTLGIALSEIGNISDRRLATLVDPATNNGLPAFLTLQGGLNSGLMIIQYTTAALVSENKILAHPASVDSIPTSANVEDLVSMGTIAARKAKEIFDNTANVLAIELISASQAIDLRKKLTKKKLKLSPQTEKIYQKIRQLVPFFPKDTIYYPYIQRIRFQLESLHE